MHQKPRLDRLIAVAALALIPLAPATQQPQLRGRWVGTHQGQVLYLDFHGDSMLVVNDRYVLDYNVTFDSLTAFGDTSFAVAYWFAVDRLLLATAEGNVVTMNRQSELARPLHGFRWHGAPTRQSDQQIHLEMFRGGVARWKLMPTGEWVDGEWDRSSRVIEFTWFPDSTMWTGRYDPVGEALLFEEAFPESGAVVLRKVYR
jgi:hypothetical protein